MLLQKAFSYNLTFPFACGVSLILYSVKVKTFFEKISEEPKKYRSSLKTEAAIKPLFIIIYADYGEKLCFCDFLVISVAADPENISLLKVSAVPYTALGVGY